MAPPDRPLARPLEQAWAPAVPLTAGPDGPRFVWVAGAFSSESLCREARLVADAALERQPERAHSVVLGVVEPRLLGDWLIRRVEVGGPGPGPAGTVLLADVVLAPGADPALRLAPSIAAAHVEALAGGLPLAVVVALRPFGGAAGLDREYLEDAPDAGGLAEQAVALSQAGAVVYRSGAAAVRAAVGLLGAGVRPLTG